MLRILERRGYLDDFAQNQRFFASNRSKKGQNRRFFGLSGRSFCSPPKAANLKLAQQTTFSGLLYLLMRFSAPPILRRLITFIKSILKIGQKPIFLRRSNARRFVLANCKLQNRPFNKWPRFVTHIAFSDLGQKSLINLIIMIFHNVSLIRKTGLYCGYWPKMVNFKSKSLPTPDTVLLLLPQWHSRSFGTQSRPIGQI